MAMHFTKLQSAGNDFVLVETGGGGRGWHGTAAAICQRHYGIGADGLLLLGKSSSADLSMRIFNADGSEAEACGNGISCLLRYAIDKGLIDNNRSEVTVETAAGFRTARLRWEKGQIARIQVAMGKPGFAATDIPLALKPNREELDIKIITDYPLTVDNNDLKLAFVSMGNPHAVYFWNSPVEDFPLGRLGPDVERHQLFPNRVNFEVAHVISRGEIEVRVWERGVGETLACGTGACAVAVAAQLLGYVDKRVDIKLPGGTLEVEWDGEGEVYLSGPTEIVFNGVWPEKQREDLTL
jgi:diaminopimelate epimerase